MQHNPAYQALNGQVNKMDEGTDTIYEEIEGTEPPLSLSSPKAADHIQYPFESHVINKVAIRRNRPRLNSKRNLCLLISSCSVAIVCFSVVSLLVSLSISISFTARVESVTKEMAQLKRELDNQTWLRAREMTQLYDRLNETQLQIELQAQDTVRRIQNVSGQISTDVSSLTTKYKQLFDHHQGCFEARRECRIDRGHGLTDYYWRKCYTDFVFINETEHSILNMRCKQEASYLGLEVATIEEYKNSTGLYLNCRCFIADPNTSGNFTRIPSYYTTRCTLVISLCPILRQNTIN